MDEDNKSFLPLWSNKLVLKFFFNIFIFYNMCSFLYWNFEEKYFSNLIIIIIVDSPHPVRIFLYGLKKEAKYKTDFQPLITKRRHFIYYCLFFKINNNYYYGVKRFLSTLIKSCGPRLRDYAKQNIVLISHSIRWHFFFGSSGWRNRNIQLPAVLLRLGKQF